MTPGHRHVLDSPCTDSQACVEKDLWGLMEQGTGLQLQQEIQSASVGCLGYPVRSCSIGFNLGRLPRKVIVPFF